MKTHQNFFVVLTLFFGVSSTGNHTLTRMYMCELRDDHTTRGSFHFLYDGKDFIRLNLSSGTWTADNHQAEQFLEAWNDSERNAESWTHDLNYRCITWLKRYLTYSNSVNPGSHTLQYLTVVSSRNATTTVQLDGETFVSYNSSDAEVIPKTEWMKKIDVDVWKSEKSRMSGDHVDLQYYLSLVEKLLNQTKGAGAEPHKWIIIVSVVVVVIVGACSIVLIVNCMKKKCSTTTRCQDFESVPDDSESM